MKPMLWSGIALFTLGATVLLLFVVPWIGGTGAGAVLLNGEVAHGAPRLAVVISSLGLAAGSALVGIGLGRWQRPRPSPEDGSPEV